MSLEKNKVDKLNDKMSQMAEVEDMLIKQLNNTYQMKMNVEE